MTQLVETITADTMGELMEKRDRGTVADMLELRLDGISDLDVAMALSNRPRPVIATCRAQWEGGRFDGAEDDRLRFLSQAVAAGAEYVDVEWRADWRRVGTRPGTQIVLSHHDFGPLPADLRDRVRAMRQTGADIVKVSMMAGSLRDCIALKRAMGDGGSHVAIAMGTAGHVSRLWPAGFGSLWTYAGTAAPGQSPPADLADVYRVRETTERTAVYAVVGEPLGHSASPFMLNAAFAEAGLDAVYVPLETHNADEFHALADDIGLAGASVTAPMKQPLLRPDVEADELTRRIGALNTLRRAGARWEGRNFDVEGFLAPLEDRSIPLHGARAVVIGAGGAARAAVWALLQKGAVVEVAARRLERARALADQFAGRADVRASALPIESAWDLLVNATPAGTSPRVDESPVGHAALAHARGKVVYDLVYNPERTRLIAAAAAAGADTVGGLEMLVSQACRQFEWWTGRPAPRQTMMAAARQFLQRC